MKKNNAAKSTQNYAGNVIPFSSYSARPAQSKELIDESTRTVRKGQSWGDADICSYDVSDDLMRGMGIFRGDAVLCKELVSFKKVRNHSLCVVKIGRRRMLRIVSFEGNGKIGIHCGFGSHYEVYSAGEVELLGIVVRVERDFDN